mgnify:CR=1 FL=1
MRAPRKVILENIEQSTMVSDWIDQIELRCDRHCNFTVVSRQYGEDDEGSGKRWTEYNRIKDLKNPKEIRDAIDSLARDLEINLNWQNAILKIAEIDWLNAAVISWLNDLPLPPLPSTDILNSQRTFRFKSKVMISLDWDYEYHDHEISLNQWIKILNFEEYTVGKWSWCEGIRSSSTWSFDRNWHSELIVSYADGGVHWEGSLESIDSISGPIIDGVDLAVIALKASSPKKN